jgi:hypothetical protein
MSKRNFPKGPLLRRGRPNRAPRLRVFIFTEGKNTEPTYLKDFAAEHGNSLVVLECEGGAGVPATLVEKAKTQLTLVRRSRNSFEKSDQVWVIFDEDEHPKVREAIAQALSLGIKVGYSNPCFEVWLILHHADHDAPDGRHAVQHKLAALDNGYDTGAKKPTYALLSPNYDQAKARAKKMRARRKKERNPLGCPYTDVDLLTEVIVINGKPKAKAP